jgi:hypothetical protein
LITDHAVKRYLARWNRGMNFAEAQRYLMDISRTSYDTGQKTLAGQSIFMADGIPLIVKNVPGKQVLVTVLDPEQLDGHDGQDLAELLRESEEDRNAMKKMVKNE